MSNIEYHINYQFDGAVQWLESRNGGYSEAEKLLNASIVICQKCPVLTTCRPRYGYKKFLGDKSGVVISGGDIASKDCLLRTQGVTREQLNSSSTDLSRTLNASRP
ncbi:hypothetical protein A2867_00380 [Candidatus Daviesbacteria bacterium RIFCSPHIGHO2_01_FULL_40_11]|uniref:Uncharacterized protein n=1 Tax=Candidatus Daviesbacteria bacterium RIFCSPHIGHO2_01_FULL_40_11 TaxID=1797762 RepID=A0A1F5JF87_9BACT|nr:MAG: hypothetical protein A2867_00380 [Candidatus Daviesbacteria bacterium RIFCSPHIGHO2_01_FULL_40_11]OGE62649.1 MAG: hypothetical protein A2964_02670 [Candidatus Daviesbacteria bacterium RIFCSPLOWO2_01_FULL_40_27]